MDNLRCVKVGPRTASDLTATSLPTTSTGSYPTRSIGRWLPKALCLGAEASDVPVGGSYPGVSGSTACTKVLVEPISLMSSAGLLANQSLHPDTTGFVGGVARPVLPHGRVEHLPSKARCLSATYARRVWRAKCSILWRTPDASTRVAQGEPQRLLAAVLS